MCMTGNCDGGSGTSGKGRTPYTPAKKSNQPWATGRTFGSGDKTKTVGTTSGFGNPKVRASFSRKK